MARYQPPYTITATIIERVAAISEALGRWSARGDMAPAPTLRRGNRIRSIQASLAIENSSLSVEQVTAVLAGKSVLAAPREVQEVRNAFVAYEGLLRWQPAQRAHLLEAHRLLMTGLIDTPGRWRGSGVGIYRNKKLVHMAPPPSRVAKLMQDLLLWLKSTDTHPLISSCVFHYEFEFIHPFADGNGRLGRLWQTLILSRWKPLLAWLPVETVIRQHQPDYYAALAAADRSANATPFVEFMVDALHQSLTEALHAAESAETSERLERPRTARASLISAVPPDAPYADNIHRLLAVFKRGEVLRATALMQRLGLKHRPSFRLRYLLPATHANVIEPTIANTPQSPNQKYRKR